MSSRPASWGQKRVGRSGGVPDQKTNIFLPRLARPGAARRASQSELGTDRVRINKRKNRKRRSVALSVGDVDPTFNFAPPFIVSRFNFAALREYVYGFTSRGRAAGAGAVVGRNSEQTEVRNAKKS